MKAALSMFLAVLVVFANFYCVVAQGLPETPAELPEDRAPGGTPAPRYDYTEKKDPLTDEISRKLLVVFSVAQEDRGFLDPALQLESLMILHQTVKNGDIQLSISLLRSSDETLGSLFFPSSKFIYRPKGQEAVTVEPMAHNIEMTSLGEYTESVTVLMSLEQLVELLASPLLRFTGNEHSKDYELTETDKKAVLWFVESKVPGGKEAVLSVRERLATLEDSPIEQ